MSALGFLGGLAGAYTAIDRGIQVAKEREQADEDRAFVKAQRGLLQRQQQRQEEDQRRADTLRAELAGIKSTEQVDLNKLNPETSKITVDDDGNPSATQLPAMVDRPRTKDAQIRDAAGAYRRAGDLGRALELDTAADREMFGRAARSFAQLKAGSANMTAAQIANQAKSIFDKDPFPMEVAAIREGEGGSVSIDIRNRDTGVTQTWNAKDKNELLSGIEAYYSPESYQALQKARAEAEARRQEKLLENPYVVVPAGARAVPKVPGLPSVDNTSGLAWTGRYNPDGSPEMVRPGRAAGEGAGGKADDKPKDPLEQALKDGRAYMDQIFSKGEVKLTPDQIGDAQQYMVQILTDAPRDKNGAPKVPPVLAANIGRKIAMNPEKVTMAINPETGLIDRVFSDDTTGETFTVRAGVGTAKSPGVPKDFDMSAAVSGMLDKLDSQSPGTKERYIAAAFDKSGPGGTSAARRALEQRELAELRRRIETEVEGFKSMPREMQEEGIARASRVLLGAISNRLDMVAMHMRPPKAASPAGADGGSSRAQAAAPGARASGLDPQRYGGLTGRDLIAAQDQDVRRQVAENRPNAQRMQEARTAAGQDQDLRRLDAERASLLRAGRAVEANAKIAEYNRIRKERYGF